MKLLLPNIKSRNKTINSNNKNIKLLHTNKKSIR